MSVSRSVSRVSFSFLPRHCNSFPTHPPFASYCLHVEFSREVYQHLGSFFAYCWLQFCWHNFVMLIQVSIECCCIVMWQSKCIQCVRIWFVLTNYKQDLQTVTETTENGWVPSVTELWILITLLVFTLSQNTSPSLHYWKSKYKIVILLYQKLYPVLTVVWGNLAK